MHYCISLSDLKQCWFFFTPLTLWTVLEICIAIPTIHGEQKSQEHCDGRLRGKCLYSLNICSKVRARVRFVFFPNLISGSKNFRAFLCNWLQCATIADITTWVDDIINMHMLWSTFLSFLPMLAAKLDPQRSKNYCLTTLGEEKGRTMTKWPRSSVTDRI